MSISDYIVGLVRDLNEKGLKVTEIVKETVKDTDKVKEAEKRKKYESRMYKWLDDKEPKKSSPNLEVCEDFDFINNLRLLWQNEFPGRTLPPVPVNPYAVPGEKLTETAEKKTPYKLPARLSNRGIQLQANNDELIELTRTYEVNNIVNESGNDYLVTDLIYIYKNKIDNANTGKPFIIVQDNSMAPEIKIGSDVLIAALENPKENFREGRIYLIIDDKNDLWLRRVNLSQQENCIRLVAANPDKSAYPDEYLNWNNVRKVFKVVEWLSKQ